MLTKLTWKKLRSQLDYNQETGWLTWKVAKQRIQKGVRAGNVSVDGKHRMVTICGENWGEHRLIWFWMTGVVPILYVDHKNRDGTQNWWGNLRLATHGQNYVNSMTFGVMRGIQHRGGEKYRVRLNYDDRRHSQQVIGLEKAIEFRRRWELTHWGEFACER